MTSTCLPGALRSRSWAALRLAAKPADAASRSRIAVLRGFIAWQECRTSANSRMLCFERFTVMRPDSTRTCCPRTARPGHFVPGMVQPSPGIVRPGRIHCAGRTRRSHGSVTAGLSPRAPIPAWPAPGYRPSGSPSGSCRPHQPEIRPAARCLYLPRPPWDAALRTARSSQLWDRREMENYTLETGRASVTRRVNPR